MQVWECVGCVGRGWVLLSRDAPLGNCRVHVLQAGAVVGKEPKIRKNTKSNGLELRPGELFSYGLIRIFDVTNTKQ